MNPLFRSHSIRLWYCIFVHLVKHIYEKKKSFYSKFRLNLLLRLSAPFSSDLSFELYKLERKGKSKDWNLPLIVTNVLYFVIVASVIKRLKCQRLFLLLFKYFLNFKTPLKIPPRKCPIIWCFGKCFIYEYIELTVFAQWTTQINGTVHKIILTQCKITNRIDVWWKDKRDTFSAQCCIVQLGKCSRTQVLRLIRQITVFFFCRFFRS